jgi:hypothetical protein
MSAAGDREYNANPPGRLDRRALLFPQRAAWRTAFICLHRVIRLSRAIAEESTTWESP